MTHPSLVFALKKTALAALVPAMLLVLSGCVPVVLAVATVSAVDLSQDRRTVGKYIDDNLLELRLRSRLSQDEALAGDINISVTSFNGVVLLTGEVNTDAQRQRAGEIVNSDASTAKLVNELELAGKTTVTSRVVNDSALTAKVKARLLNDEGNLAQKIKVVTEHGKVYLLGIVTQEEADAAVDAAGAVRGVTHIVKVFEYIE